MRPIASFSARRRSARSTCTAALLAALLAAPAYAQSTAPLAEIIDVELVNVDVWVTDNQGEPVTGLGRADFEVLHDGRPVEVTHFREVREGRGVDVAGAQEDSGASDGGALTAANPDAREGGTAAAPAPAHVIVYFDQTRLRPTNYKPLIAALRSLLASEAIAPERVLVLRQQRGLSVEQPFGSTTKELDAALDRIAASPPPGFDGDTETRLAVDAIRDAWEREQGDLGSAQTSIGNIPAATPGEPGTAGGSPRDVVGGFGSGTGPDACGSFLSQIRPTLDAWARSRGQAVAVTLANLTDAASFLAGIPGVKLLLYLSDGLEIDPGTDLATYASGLCPAGSADLLTSLRSASMNDRFLELTRHANANRVTIHALQTTGLQGSQFGDASSGRRARGGGATRASRGFESSRRSVDREGLSLLAAETGGRAIYNRNEFETELGQIGRDAANYYSLAFEPPAPEQKSSRDHRIEVRVRRDAATARYRRGYVEKDDKQWLGERVEGALNLGITENRLGVRLAAASATPGPQGGRRIPLHVVIPADRLAFLPLGEGHVARVSIKVMARSLSSNTVSIWDKNFQIRGTPGSSGWADLTIELDLPPGAYLTGVGVRDDATREASFLSTTLETGAGS